jgi:endonuclease-3 related protein
MSNNYQRLLMQAYNRMLSTFGPLGWWPGDSPWEVMVGAILTQNTAWVNVETAITNLKTNGLLAHPAIAAAPLEQLAQLIKPSGYFNQKAKKLKALVDFFKQEYGASIDQMRREDTSVLRDKLLNVWGIGPETADSILLYALDKPVFVVDAYTRRIFSRHGFFPEDITYSQMQDFFETYLPPDVELYNEYHAQIVYTGKGYCRTKPRCEGCPLEGFNNRDYS